MGEGMRLLVLGFVALSACRLVGQSTHVTPLAAPLPALAANCPVTATRAMPPAGADVRMIAVVRCGAALQSECDDQFRKQACRLGGNYVFGTHVEHLDSVGTVAFYRPAASSPDAGALAPTP